MLQQSRGSVTLEELFLLPEAFVMARDVQQPPGTGPRNYRLLFYGPDYNVKPVDVPAGMPIVVDLDQMAVSHFVRKVQPLLYGKHAHDLYFLDRNPKKFTFVVFRFAVRAAVHALVAVCTLAFTTLLIQYTDRPRATILALMGLVALAYKFVT